MPRVAAGRSGAPAKQVDRLSRCIAALLQNPEAACIGGSELCCAGGGCGSDPAEQIVGSLAAFVSHSDAAMRRFVAAGGLEAVHILASRPLKSASSGAAGPGPGSSTYTTESDWDDGEEPSGTSDAVRAMGALAILQSMTASQEGQNLVLQRRPELLQVICQLASPGDEVEEEYDGDLRHAALQLLIGWHYTAARQHYGDVIASWFAQRALSDRCMCMLSVALEAVDHPSMAVRKAAAHLFSEAAEYARSSSREAVCSYQLGPNGNGSVATSSPLTAPMPEAVALLARLSGEVDQLLGSCARQADPDAAAPQVHSLMQQGPMTASLLLGQQLATQKKKHKVQGLMEVACALLECSPHGIHLLGASGAIRVLVRTFSLSWSLPEPQVPLLPSEEGTEEGGASALGAAAGGAAAGGATTGGRSFTGSGANGAPFKFSADPAAADLARRQQQLATALLHQSAAGGGGGGVGVELGGALIMPLLQDHQTRERALDMLLLLLRRASRGSLEALGRCAPKSMQWPRGAGGSCGGPVAAGLSMLQLLVLEMLHKHTPAHVRGALALLGAVRMAPEAPGGLARSPHGSYGSFSRGSSEACIQPASALDDEDPSRPSASPPAPEAPKGEQPSTSPAASPAAAAERACLTELLTLLSQVFDLAWAQEGAAATAAAGPAPITSSPNPAAAASLSQPVTVPTAPSHAAISPAMAVPAQPSQTVAADPATAATTLPLFGASPVAAPRFLPSSPQPQASHPSFPSSFPTVPSLGGDGASPSFFGSPVGASPPSASGPIFAFSSQPPLPGSSPTSHAPRPSPRSSAHHKPAPALPLPPVSSVPAPPLATLPGRPGLTLDLGLGYRVLVQVLHAWRDLSASGDQEVVAALEAACCWQRVALAKLHDRPQVVAAAGQVHLQQQLRDQQQQQHQQQHLQQQASDGNLSEQVLGLTLSGRAAGPSSQPSHSQAALIGAAAGASSGLSGQDLRVGAGQGLFMPAWEAAAKASGGSALDPALYLPAGWDEGFTTAPQGLAGGVGDEEGEDDDLLQFLREVVLGEDDEESQQAGRRGAGGENGGNGIIDGAAVAGFGGEGGGGVFSREVEEAAVACGMFDPWEELLMPPLPPVEGPAWSNGKAGGEQAEHQPMQEAGWGRAGPNTDSFPSSSSTTATLPQQPQPQVTVQAANLRAGAGGPPKTSSSQAQKTDQQLVSEALELLPDLDAVAQRLCVKYDILECA